MKIYKLTVIGANDQIYDEVEAEYLQTTTSGYYAFFSNGELIACYPTNRTIINKIEEIE
jgi:hypothetical protein